MGQGHLKREKSLCQKGSPYRISFCGVKIVTYARFELELQLHISAERLSFSNITLEATNIRTFPRRRKISCH